MYIIRIAAFCLPLLLVGPTAGAADGSTLGTLELYATIHSAGVTVSVSGDDDKDATVTVEYRAKGASSFTKGHPLVRLTQGRFKGSLFYLSAGTVYEVKVSLSDPDNSATTEKSGSVTTRADQPPAASGATIHVSAGSGKDANAGTKDAPLATIGKALGLAKPGDTVLVHRGVYRETVMIEKSGTATAPIWIRGETGAVLDGSDTALATGPSWTHYKDKIYRTDYKGPATWYAAAGEKRLYHYTSLAGLEQQSGGQAGKTGVLKGGFYINSSQQIYLRLPDGSSPTLTTINAAAKQRAFYSSGQSHVVIDGFEIRFYGVGWDAAFDLRNTKGFWVRNCKVHNVLSGVWLHKGGGGNVIEKNSFKDTSVYAWPWDSVKSLSAEQTAVSVQGGRGDIVRDNTVEGYFNGIYTGKWGTFDEAIAPDIDVYRNTLRKLGDDGFEPEGACVNQRFFDNSVTDVHNAISLSPIETGPTWFIRTRVLRYNAHALKVNNSPKGYMFVYHTTAVPGANSEAQPLEPSKPFGNLVTRNNIFWGHRYVMEYMGTSLTGPVDMDYDDLYTDNKAKDMTRFVKWLNVRYDDLKALVAGTGLEPHGFSIEPRFVNLAAGDLTLVAGHPLLDTAQPIPGINHLGLHGKPDVGAVERLPGGGGDGGTGGEGEEDGCGCGVGGGGAASGLLLLLLLLWRRPSPPPSG